MITEKEWREKKRFRTSGKRCWGAQFYDKHSRLRRWIGNRPFQRMILLASLMISLCVLGLAGRLEPEFGDVLLDVQTNGEMPRSVSAVQYHLPMDMDYKQQVFSREELARGRMLLIDQEHPLPADALPPNCYSIARFGHGMIPVRSLEIKTGNDTIEALKALFDGVKAQNISDLFVCKGTVSKEEQKQSMIAFARDQMRQTGANQAIQKTLQQNDWPGTGEYVQEYAVEIRLIAAKENEPVLTAWEATHQGQTLLQLAWRYGFVRPRKDQPFCFRYVGNAHATAMTYLDLDYKAYLSWLHQKGCVVIREGEKVRYLILCQPMDSEYIAFDLPEGCEYEASLDNTGYALVACTL